MSKEAVEKITSGNAWGERMCDTDFYLWLKEGGYTGHVLNDNRKYLHERGFVLGEDRLPQRTITTLRYVHDQYFRNEILPKLQNED
jgi:hypothetical protein